MTVMIYYAGGPLDAEHQSREAVNTTPGYTETILIEANSYLDPTGADYIPPTNVPATYAFAGPITTPAYTFTGHVPDDLPADGLIPANWDGAGRPPTPIQFVIGGQVTYNGPDGPEIWLYTGTGWVEMNEVEIDIDGDYVFTYVPTVQT